MYDAREKALRDYQSAISAALLEGEEKGRAEGEQRGALIGRIEVFQEILGISPTNSETLRTMSTEDLQNLAMDLQKTVRERPTSSS